MILFIICLLFSISLIIIKFFIKRIQRIINIDLVLVCPSFRSLILIRSLIIIQFMRFIFFLFEIILIIFFKLLLKLIKNISIKITFLLIITLFIKFIVLFNIVIIVPVNSFFLFIFILIRHILKYTCEQFFLFCLQRFLIFVFVLTFLEIVQLIITP